MEEGSPSENRSIKIGKDAIGNAILSGNGNIVIFQASRQVKEEETVVPEEIGQNPYKGLLAFDEEDSDLYFGREEQIERLWVQFCQLHRETPQGEMPLRLLPILGPSGCGKSSLARAGLIPELARRPLPGRKKGRVAILTPGAHPLEALAGVLAKVATNDPIPVTKTREFVEELKLTNEIGEYDGLRRTADLLPDIAGSPLIVLVDQFEEVFSLCKVASERQIFIENLLVAASEQSAYVSVVLTLRTDFLGETQKYPKLNQLIASQGQIIPAMNQQELRRAITEPAKLAGHPLDQSTVDLLIQQTEGREGALPLLEFALTRIWEGLREGVEPSVTLKQLGEVGGALAGEAQRIYDNLNEDEKEIARRVFLGLVQLGEGTKDTRRRTTIDSLISYQETPEQVEKVIRRFSHRNARLITLASKEGETTIAEVTHEALFDHWGILRQWIEQNRDLLRQQRKIEASAEDWRIKGKSKGYLLQGRQLTDAKIFQQEHGKILVLSKLAEDFIRESFRQKWINRLKFVSLILILIVAIPIPIEGYLRQESIRKNLDIYRTGDQYARRKAYNELTEGCLEQQQIRWLPKYLTDRLFGNCESLSIDHPAPTGSSGDRFGDQFEYLLGCGKVNSTSPKPIPGILLAGGAEESTPGEHAATRWFLKRADGGDYLVLRFGIGRRAEWNCRYYRDVVSSAAELSIPTLEAASNPEVIQRILDAEALFIPGGDTKLYEGYWIGSPAVKVVNHLINKKKVPIGATSAGMAILGEYYYVAAKQGVRSSQILDNPFHDNTKDIYRSDFIKVPFLKQVITDTYLDSTNARNLETRYGRIFGLIARVVHDWKSCCHQ